MRLLQLAKANIADLSGGASLRNYYLARALAGRISITHLGLDGPGQLCRRTNQKDGIRMTLVPEDKRYTLSKLVRGALGEIPITLLGVYGPAMAAELTEELAEYEYEAVLIEGIEMSVYLPIIMRARRRPTGVVLDWHNVESLVAARYANHAARVHHRLYMRRAASQLQRIEGELLRSCGLHLATSHSERDQLLLRHPEANVVVIENGVDVSQFTPPSHQYPYGDDWANRRRIVFVGSMDYSANVDAVLYFAEQVWPSIQEMFRTLVFTIVGRNPPDRVRALTSRPGIEVTGTLDDVRPYYQQAFAAVVPLRVGGGTRLKILEAMAAGVPVVSTRIGAEGLRVEPELHFMLADTPQEFMVQIQRLRADSYLWQHFSVAGRNLVEATYDWSIIGERLADAYEDFVGRQRIREGQVHRSVLEA